MSCGGNIEVRLDSGETRRLVASDETRSLADILAAQGLPLNTRCGQRGRCRGCEMDLISGSVSVDGTRVTAPAVVKACRARLAGDLAFHLPDRSRLEHRPQVSETFEIAVPYAHQPLFPFTPGRDTAFAVDVGTTTVVVLLVDLKTGDVLSRAGGFNEQIRFGDNVVTRIEAAQKPEQLAAMQRAVVMETIQPLLKRALEQAGRPAERIAGGTIAANTTMLHLLAGEDPTPLGVAPFTPRFIAGRTLAAREVGLVAEGLAVETPIQLLPGIAAYVGADITAGMLATGMCYDEKPALLVDIGTNGEIVLQADGRFFGCATAAGPAFEGCGLSCGTRARTGAVSDLSLALNPFLLKVEVIGATSLARAEGICGSAYLDFLATARQIGLLGTTGRFELRRWEELPETHRWSNDDQRAVRLAARNGPDDLRISEVDVALLLQAKAAIGAGIEVLLETAGIRAADVGTVYLAGGFGMHLDVAHAIAIGLLPGFDVRQVKVVGNTSLAGALLALLDRTLLAEMENLRARVRVVELNLTDGFEDRYVEHLLLP
ncbi:MAG: ASKHA domain-containing protein [Verrucomicrobiota bacterium]